MTAILNTTDSKLLGDNPYYGMFRLKQTLYGIFC